MASAYDIYTYLSSQTHTKNKFPIEIKKYSKDIYTVFIPLKHKFKRYVQYKTIANVLSA